MTHPNQIPSAFDLLDLAEEFFQAFKDLPLGEKMHSWPRYFLLCHAIELVLKAFLATRGVDDKQLKRYGHGLSDLLVSSKKQGLKIGILALGELECLDEAHSELWSRYPRKVAKPVFLIENFEVYASELFRAVRA